MKIYFFLVVVNFCFWAKGEVEIRDYSTPDDCNEQQYFDSIKLKCSECFVQKTDNQLNLVDVSSCKCPTNYSLVSSIRFEDIIVSLLYSQSLSDGSIECSRTGCPIE